MSQGPENIQPVLPQQKTKPQPRTNTAKPGKKKPQTGKTSQKNAPCATDTGEAGGKEDEEDEDEWEDDEDDTGDEEIGDEAPKRRKSKTQTERMSAKGKPPGPKGRFLGEQRSLLEELVPKYDAVPKGKRGKNPALQQFWKQAEDAFWGRFTIAEARAQMGEAYVNATRSVVLCKTNESIRNWFRWRTRTAGTNSPWQTALLFLRRSADSAPKRMATWQCLHSKKSEEIQALYEARNDNDTFEIVARNEIARELFEKMSEEEKAGLEKEIDEQFQEQKKRYDAGVEGLETPSREDQLEARERLCGVVWPLLQLISKYTGLQCLTLLGAEAPANPTDNFKISVVNYGETTGDIPHDFRSFNGPGFNGVLGVFAQFVAAVAGLEPSVTDNGLPSFKIQLVEAKSNDKQNAPAKPTNNAKATSAQAPAPVLAGSSPAPVLAESGSSTAVGSVDAERISRVAPKPRTRRGKANDASACPVPSEQAGSALPSTSTTTTPFPDLVHYGPNDGVQPFLNVRQPSAAAGVDDVQPVAPTFFNIDPSLLTELSTPYGSSARVPPPSAQIPGTRSSGSAHHHPTAAGPTPIIDLNAASVVAQPPTSTVLPSGIPFPVAVFPSHQQQVDVRQIEHHPLPSPGMLSSANGEATDTDVSTTANSKPTAIITPIDTPNVDDAPILIQDQLQRFSKTAVPASVIVPWTRLLQDWVELERMRKYESKRSGLCPRGRPGAVSWWIKSARKGRVEPTVMPAEDYVQQWHTWWQSMNPSWRDCEDGRLVIGGDGSWDTMSHTGTNGWVNIIASIDALCRVADQSTISYAITDADWVLNQVLQVEKGANAVESSQLGKRSSVLAGVGEAPAAKRARVPKK